MIGRTNREFRIWSQFVFLTKEVFVLEEWRKNLKNKPARYWSRIEIEEIVKEKNIDRNRFYEYSKNKYLQVINRFIIHL